MRLSMFCGESSTEYVRKLASVGGAVCIGRLFHVSAVLVNVPLQPSRSNLLLDLTWQPPERVNPRAAAAEQGVDTSSAKQQTSFSRPEQL